MNIYLKNNISWNDYFQYEQELNQLRQQLAETQKTLSETHCRLLSEEPERNDLVSTMRSHLGKSEERLKVQQVEKDTQMKDIIHRSLAKLVFATNALGAELLLFDF